VNGYCKLTAQNRGGCVEGAVVVRDARGRQRAILAYEISWFLFDFPMISLKNDIICCKSGWGWRVGLISELDFKGICFDFSWFQRGVRDFFCCRPLGGMSLSCVQHLRDQLQSCMRESDRISTQLTRCFWTTCWSTDHRRTLCEWSITHGPPGERQHVWTFAAGPLETANPSFPLYFCTCVGGTVPPTFVGNDYFCESGNPGTTWTNILYASDPLWVVDPLPAAIWPHHLVWLPPGSASSYPRPQLMIMKFVFVEMKELLMKTLQLNLFNSTSTKISLMSYATVWTQTATYFLVDWDFLEPARNVDW